MKAIINVDNAFGENPKFDPMKPLDRETNWPELHRPRGTVIDHPESWLLCVGSDPSCEPADDECRAKVAPILEAKAARAKAQAEEEPVDADEPGTKVRTRKRAAD